MLLFALLACQPDLTVPAPRLTAASPLAFCREQLDTLVTVTGSGFAPVPTEMLGKPALLLPKLSLVPGVDLSGAPLAGAELALPDAVWVDAGTLNVTLTPALALAEGAYGLRLINPMASLPASTSRSPPSPRPSSPRWSPTASVSRPTPSRSR